MQRNHSKQRKWYRRLFSCVKSDINVSEKYEYLPIVLEEEETCQHTARNKFELILETEGLLYKTAPLNGEPVLNLGVGLTEQDLVSKKGLYVSLTNFKSSCLQVGFEKIAEEFYYDEPVVDGLPASLWLECIEPTLAILTSLNSLKHRRSNLVVKKPRPIIPDSQQSRHGDFEYGPMGILELPRRITLSMRLDIVLYGNRDEHTIEMQIRSNRVQNRRRNHRRYNVTEELAMELNTNQSANTDDSDVSNSRAGGFDRIHAVCAKPTIVTIESVGEMQGIEGVIIVKEAVSSRLGQADARQEQQETTECLNAKITDATITLNSPGTTDQPSECSRELPSNIIADVDGQESGFNNDFGRGVQHISSIAPYLYFWNPKARIFEQERFVDYNMEYMKIVKSGIRRFLTMKPDSTDCMQYSNRIAKFVANDYFSRRLLMYSVNYELTDAKKCLSLEDLKEAQLFLRIEDLVNADCVVDLSSVDDVEDEQPPLGLFRRTMNTVRRLFNQIYTMFRLKRSGRQESSYPN